MGDGCRPGLAPLCMSFAPGILDLEVPSAIAWLERQGSVSRAQADTAITHFSAMPLNRIPADVLLPGVWRHRHAMRIADAFYIAAAQAVGGELLTRDARLARTPGLPVPVTLIPR